MLFNVAYDVCKRCPHLQNTEQPGGRLYFFCELTGNWSNRTTIFYAKRHSYDKKDDQELIRVIWEREFEIPAECPFTLDYTMMNSKRLQHHIELCEAKQFAKEIYEKCGVLTEIEIVDEDEDGDTGQPQGVQQVPALRPLAEGESPQ